MTQQDDITQRVLTDDEINTAIDWPAANTTMRAENDRAMAREVEAAVLRKLSKLRASVADETALQAWADRFPEISDMGRLRDAWNDARACTPAPGWGCAHKNKVANVAAYVWFCRDCNKFIPREPGDSALASAPVDPEATEVDFLVRVFENLDTWRAEDWNELLERRPAILAMLRPLVLASAPVAGEAQPLGYVRKGREWPNQCYYPSSHKPTDIHNWTPVFDHAAPQASAEYERGHADGWAAGWDQAIKQPQADKDGGQQLRWRVTDDMRYAVRFAPSSAHWSERLKEFFGPDAREGIDALESQLREARAMLDRQPKLRADASAVRRALIAASNYIDTLGGDSKSYRAALSATQAEQGERDA